jgi:hypothetical protein
MIHAIDRDHRALAGIPDRYDSVEIRKSVGDLNDTGLSLPKVDGMLIANTLHFIRGQEALLSRLLSVADRILVVEYERFLPNPWGPYPAGFQKLRKLCSRVGLGTVEKIGTRPSRFGGMMYSALAMKK